MGPVSTLSLLAQMEILNPQHFLGCCSALQGYGYAVHSVHTAAHTGQRTVCRSHRHTA